MAKTLPLPLPGVEHGERMALSVVDEWARTDPQSPWVSTPIDDQDISKGYKDITYGQFANAIDHAAHRLVQHLPTSQELFLTFAYVGTTNLRYPILAMAAGEVQKVASPELEGLLRDEPAEPFVYRKSWKEGKDDPWLVFHTSGTTGNSTANDTSKDRLINDDLSGYPKPITYTHRMMAIPDMAARLAGDEETHLHHYVFKRWYTPLPLIRFVGMLMVLSMGTSTHTVLALGPSTPPSPEMILDILKFGKVDSALLAPVTIDTLCRDVSGLAALRSLQYIHYAGAPLGVNSGKKPAASVRLIPCIGSTEVGGYFLKLRDDMEDWDYVQFNSHAGAVFELRFDHLHELVFVRKPECEPMQQMFLLYPDRDRFETNDLWVEHPTRKGL
ncbi:hypothetical protein MMC25_006144 [Agyrium rufum]|nr:hypothetical protein [Agyrium rufum]